MKSLIFSLSVSLCSLLNSTVSLFASDVFKKGDLPFYCLDLCEANREGAALSAQDYETLSQLAGYTVDQDNSGHFCEKITEVWEISQQKVDKDQKDCQSTIQELPQFSDHISEHLYGKDYQNQGSSQDQKTSESDHARGQNEHDDFIKPFPWEADTNCLNFCG